MYKRPTAGFTLIELLVVISVIAFMSAVVFSSVANARKKGIGTKTANGMRQLQLAIELYKTTHNNLEPLHYQYPGTYNEWYEGSDMTTLLDPLRTGGYIKTLPTTPTSLYMGYVSYPKSNSDPANEYFACGNTPFGMYTIYLRSSPVTAYNLKGILPEMKFYYRDESNLPYVLDTSGAYNGWYCITSQ